MAGLADLFSGQEGPDPTNFLQNLGIALSLMGQGIEGKGDPLQTIGYLQQQKQLRRKDALAQQQAQIAGQVGGMIAGDLRPGEEGPPQPFDWSLAMAMSANIPELRQVLVSPQFFQWMQSTGRMENPGRLQAETALSAEQALGGPPKGTFRSREITPQGVSFKDEPPKSLEQIQALNVPKLAQTPQQQMSLVDFTKLEPQQLSASINNLMGRVQQLRTQIEGGMSEQGFQIPGLDTGPAKKKAIEDLIAHADQIQEMYNLLREKIPQLPDRTIYPGMTPTEEQVTTARKAWITKRQQENAVDPSVELRLPTDDEVIGQFIEMFFMAPPTPPKKKKP